MSIYSQDLRQRVVQAYERGEGSYAKLAERFMMNASTARDWVKLKRTTGGSQAKRCGPKPQDLEVWRERLSMLLGEDNDATLAELVERLEARYRVKTSKSAVDRWLRSCGISRKKRPSMPRRETASASKG